MDDATPQNSSLLDSVGGDASSVIHTGGSVLSFICSHWWILALVLCPVMIGPLITFVHEILNSLKLLRGPGSAISTALDGLLHILNDWSMSCVRCDKNPDKIPGKDANAPASWWDHISCFFYESTALMSFLGWLCPGFAGGAWIATKKINDKYDWVWKEKGDPKRVREDVARREGKSETRVGKEMTARYQKIKPRLEKIFKDNKIPIDQKLQRFINDRAWRQATSEIDQASIEDASAREKSSYNASLKSHAEAIKDAKDGMTEDNQKRIQKAEESDDWPKLPDPVAK